MKTEKFTSKKAMAKHEKAEPKKEKMMEKKLGLKPIVTKSVKVSVKKTK